MEIFKSKCNYLCLLLFLYLFSSSSTQLLDSKEQSQKKTLVLLDDWHTIDTHSLFFEQIKNMGYLLEFKMIDDSDIKLTYFGEYLYTNIIYMASSFNEDISKKNDIQIQTLLKYLDDGHDMLLFANKDVGNFLRKLSNEFGVDFDDYDSQIKDSLYIHNLKSSLNSQLISMGNDEIVVTKNAINVPVIVRPPKGYILYEGIGMDLDPQNQYVFPILKADENSYSVNAKTNEVYANGDKVKMVAGYQARNNRRVVISGSANMCSDKMYYLSNVNGINIAESPNAKFCMDILNWNFQRSGVLKFENVRHNRKSDGKSLSTYRIKDELEYFIDIYEYEYKTDSWKPYVTDDIQIEYVMMNPYYINQLKMVALNKPTYYVQFKAPEKFGVFKFIVDYKRLGYSYIFSSTKVPLRPFNHNEYLRFLPCAYPYYLSVFTVLGSFVLFSILFLYGKKKEE